MPLSNDERGWVMTALSGIACVLGASIICVDIIIRQFPGKKHFRIQDSDAFLSASLSLSFGVMLFSSLYSMLPSAKQSLQNGGFSPEEAAWILIACFIGGVAGIQVVSRIMHSFIPSHIVDCAHTHDEDDHTESGNVKETTHKDHDQSYEQAHSHGKSVGTKPKPKRKTSLPGHMYRPDETQPMRQVTRQHPSSHSHSHSHTPLPQHASIHATQDESSAVITPQRTLKKRPSFHQRVTAGLKKVVVGTDPDECGCDAPCYGFTDPCGSDCFKSINARGGFKASAGGKPALGKHATAQSALPTTESTPLLQVLVEPSTSVIPDTEYHAHESHDHAHTDSDQSDETLATPQDRRSSQPDHHHHVPTNAFLSIGLQTSIAIALHKLPEGFITYATNHANPKLGVAVFLALFVHNITEGFALALPLYLAINSRVKAMLISFVLGGLSQPMGAAVAAIWFKIAGQGDWAPSEGVYGGMFAVTAGIMASVALSLFSEALDLTHSRNLCMIGAFTGMAILGMSSALTA